MPQLFLLHAILAVTVVAWFLLGFAKPVAPVEAVGVDPIEAVGPVEANAPIEATAPIEAAGQIEAGPGEAYASMGSTEAGPAAVPRREPLLRVFAAQLGFRAPSVPAEIGVGLLTGLGAWLAVIAALMVIAGLMLAMGGERLLPKAPPALVPWIAALPFGVRVLVSLSAGVVEETFFRGFLQPRIGIFLSTAFFALAHASYGQPFMLIGITLLSLAYAALVKWRRNIWPAIAAHALFDAVQLLVVIPAALRFLGAQGPA